METNNFIISKDKKSIRSELWLLVYDIILARYEYEGIDDEGVDMELDSIERALMYSGMCAIFRNNNGKVVALPCVMQKLNQYGRPSTVMAYRFAYQEHPDVENPKLEPMTQNLVVGKDCALILNNSNRTSSMLMVQPYITRLSKIWKEHGNNLSMSRVFAMVSGLSETIEALTNKYEKMLESGILCVPATDVEMMTKQFQKFDLNVEYRGEQYQKDWDETWAKMLTALGLNNVGTEKRERLLVDEISANNEVLTIIRNSTYKYREAGIKQANKLFGTNLKIKRGGETEDERTEATQNSQGDREVGGNDNE